MCGRACSRRRRVRYSHCLEKAWRTRKMIARRVVAVLVTLGMPVAGFAATCESLASLKLSNTTITMALPVQAGAFTPPPAAGRGARGGNPFETLPAFCRVAATLAPTSDSDIKVEVWLPLSGWNGKYQAVGNGGWAGTISYPAMAAAL